MTDFVSQNQLSFRNKPLVSSVLSLMTVHSIHLHMRMANAHKVVEGPFKLFYSYDRQFAFFHLKIKG